MNILVPPTVRQARWMIVGGVFITMLGAVRGYTFFAHGGVTFLVLGVLFVGVGIASVGAAVMRIRHGDPPRPDPDSR